MSKLKEFRAIVEKRLTKKEIKAIEREALKEALNGALQESPQKFMSLMHAEAWNQDIKMDMHIKWAFEGLDHFGLKFIIVDKDHKDENVQDSTTPDHIAQLIQR